MAFKNPLSGITQDGPVGQPIQAPGGPWSNYDSIRAEFATRSHPMQPGSGQPLTNANGFTWTNAGPGLTERFSGFDKLFWTLVNGIVYDPDYALQKDPKVYGRMMRDPQIYYCLEVRKSATASLPWSIHPPEKYNDDPYAQDLAQRTEARIRGINNVYLLFDHMLDCFLPGLSVNELIWKLNESGEWVVNMHEPKNKDRFTFDSSGNARLKSPRSPITGEPLPPFKFLVHTFNTADGAWADPGKAGYVFYGRGLADTPLYHYFYFKMISLKYLLKSLEVYGMPQKFLYTGAQQGLIARQLSSIMGAVQNDSVVSLPGKKGEVDVEVVRAAGSASPFIEWIEYIDRLMMRAILGQELMTEMPDTGSYAAAQVHQGVFARLVEKDKNQLQDRINSTLLRYDWALNMPHVPECMRPVFTFKSSPLIDTHGFLATATQVAGMGLSISGTQVRELTGLRAPREGEEVVGVNPATGQLTVLAGAEGIPGVPQLLPPGQTAGAPIAQEEQAAARSERGGSGTHYDMKFGTGRVLEQWPVPVRRKTVGKKGDVARRDLQKVTL